MFTDIAALYLSVFSWLLFEFTLNRGLSKSRFEAFALNSPSLFPLSPLLFLISLLLGHDNSASMNPPALRNTLLFSVFMYESEGEISMNLPNLVVFDKRRLY